MPGPGGPGGHGGGPRGGHGGGPGGHGGGPRGGHGGGPGGFGGGPRGGHGGRGPRPMGGPRSAPRPPYHGGVGYRPHRRGYSGCCLMPVLSVLAVIVLALAMIF